MAGSADGPTMAMNFKTRAQIPAAVVITIVSALIGVAYAPILGAFLDVEVGGELILRFAAQGVLIGVFFSAFELYYAQGRFAEWFRRQPFPVAFLGKSLATAAVLFAALMIGGALILPDRFAAADWGQEMLRDIGLSLAIAFIFQFVLIIRSVVGGRVLGNLIFGRYHRPLREDRLFMFLDLADSTTMAERLGDIEAQTLITRFFFDVAQVTAAHGGETHRYIGDQVVVTWDTARGTRDAACIRCCLAIDARIKERAADYRKRFGWVPGYRIGLHAGPVVAAECGDDKHEIVYFGDTRQHGGAHRTALQGSGDAAAAVGPVAGDDGFTARAPRRTDHLGPVARPRRENRAVHGKRGGTMTGLG